jgi:hypothetical protein
MATTLATAPAQPGKQRHPPRINASHVRRGWQCPECASTRTESNGATEYRCVTCDHRWGFEGGPRGEPYGF